MRGPCHLRSETCRMHAATSNPRCARFLLSPESCLRSQQQSISFACETKPTCHPVSSPTSPTLKMGQLRLKKVKGLVHGHKSKSVAEPGQTPGAEPTPSSHQTLQFCKPTPPVFSPYQGLDMPLSLRPTNHLPKLGPGQQAAAGRSAVAHLGALNPELGGSKNLLQRQLPSMPGLAPSSL